ncbi:hypothetical protein BBF96_01960 [Anoxybacter fermentans]|uniref:HNH nuclease domain-containing protein n=1 Tax=Anoxybacter fermentans TaxID=1323375 RepID=A0A3Q9HNV1_9FIRM|nr:HNH endonuclease [Anoxybacter fermentans]AZR72270.1 hypothetical protein BBF96_01960 [Anoxybacter fermentans]
MKKLLPGDILYFEEFKKYHKNIRVGIYIKKGHVYSIRFDTSEHGEYPDRWIRKGELLDYSGQGKKGDQTWNLYNSAMRKAQYEEYPIKLFETLHGNPMRYKYYGEWYVINSYEKIFPSGQKLIRFTISKFPKEDLKKCENEKEVILKLSDDLKNVSYDIIEPPNRYKATINRVIRDTQKANQLKEVYNWTCQICNQRLPRNSNEYYVEVHHIQPLGGKHNGVDEFSNMLVLCPNHHALFDYGVIGIGSNLEVISYFDVDCKGKKIYFREDHKLDPAVIDYHNHVILQTS